MSNTENGTPSNIPMMIGFFNILTNAFLIPAVPLCLSFPPNVRAITDIILYIGTADTIMRGAMPELPQIFSTNATPRTAALPLAPPCTNAPIMVLSLQYISANTHTSPNIMIVPKKQNRTNFTLRSSNMEVVAISLNSRTGRATLNTYLFATLANSSVIICIFIRNHPRSITRNIGIVAFMLNIKLSISTHPHNFQFFSKYLLTFAPIMHIMQKSV